MNQQQIVQLITQIATQNGINPSLMIADARVESGLNPGAVGDHGTSFGLFQDHVGGAGGSTLASAQRYLNPAQSIQHAAQRFKGAQNAEDIYRAQRPADHAGYVAKLNSALGGGGVQLNAPVSGGAQSPTVQGGPASGGLNRKAMAINAVFADDPTTAGILNNAVSQQGAPAASPTVSGGGGDLHGLVDSAMGEVGTTTKDALKYIKQAGGTGNEPWCGDFVIAMFKSRGLQPPPARSVPHLMDWAKQTGHLTKNPNPGDLVTYDWNHDGTPDHVEFVRGVDATGVNAVGGNTGHGVVAAQHRNTADVFGYVRSN